MGVLVTGGAGLFVRGGENGILEKPLAEAHALVGKGGRCGQDGDREASGDFKAIRSANERRSRRKF